MTGTESDRDELQARYEQTLKEYEAWDRWTDKHLYPSGMNKLLFLGRELERLRTLLA